MQGVWALAPVHWGTQCRCRCLCCFAARVEAWTPPPEWLRPPLDLQQGRPPETHEWIEQDCMPWMSYARVFRLGALCSSVRSSLPLIVRSGGGGGHQPAEGRVQCVLLHYVDVRLELIPVFQLRLHLSLGGLVSAVSSALLPRAERTNQPPPRTEQEGIPDHPCVHAHADLQLWPRMALPWRLAERGPCLPDK